MQAKILYQLSPSSNLAPSDSVEGLLQVPRPCACRTQFAWFTLQVLGSLSRIQEVPRAIHLTLVEDIAKIMGRHASSKPHVLTEHITFACRVLGNEGASVRDNDELVDCELPTTTQTLKKPTIAI